MCVLLTILAINKDFRNKQQYFISSRDITGLSFLLEDNSVL